FSDASGAFEFYPIPLTHQGDYTFTVRATDTAGNTSSFSRTVTRNAQLETDLLPPDVTLSLSQTTAAVGDSVLITVTATDNVGVADEELLIDGAPLALDASGHATFTPTAAGIFTVRAVAHDPSGNQGEVTREVSVFAPGAATPPTAAFEFPS